MIKEQGVEKSFHRNGTMVQAVKPITFELEQGDVLSLVGESGSGKTTLSRILSGLLPPDSGEITIDGLNIYGNRNRRQMYHKMQLVLQNSAFALNPSMTIYQCLAEPMKNILKLSKPEIKERVAELLKQTDLPEDILKRKPRQISGGQQKRVCIARAISVKPKFIIFDEAVTGLDVVVKQQIMELLKTIQKEENMTYLFISHDLEIALYLANKVFVMKEGMIVERVNYCGEYSCFQHNIQKNYYAYNKGVIYEEVFIVVFGIGHGIESSVM